MCPWSQATRDATRTPNRNRNASHAQLCGVPCGMGVGAPSLKGAEGESSCVSEGLPGRAGVNVLI